MRGTINGRFGPQYYALRRMYYTRNVLWYCSQLVVCPEVPLASAILVKSLIMAAEAPDPKAFGSCEEAFQFPVSTVRAMEGQLRRNIDLNRERLRSLVGYERDPYFQILAIIARGIILT